MFFDHPRVGMPKVLGDYKKGYAVHSGETCPSVAQRMKVDRGVDFGAPARISHWPQLMALAPRRAVEFEEHYLTFRSATAALFEEGCAVIGQDAVARLAGLADADRPGRPRRLDQE